MSADPFFGLGGVGDWNALFCNPICDYSFVVDNPGSWTSDAAPPPVPGLGPVAFALLGFLLGAAGLRGLTRIPPTAPYEETSFKAPKAADISERNRQSLT